ncbi:MAG TPA: hypothetical protein VN280_16230 [Variovorax sp.]|jgi:hypothetical protein|nr:hypothetical protein [Variovorax sp.]
MVSPPTDRLHKFLAISGIAVVAASISVPLQRYQDAELQRITAEEKLQQAGYALGRFSNSLAKQVPVAKEVIKRWPSADAAQPFVGRLNELVAETEKLSREAETAVVESKKQVSLMQHYLFMKNLWFGIGMAGMLFGCWLSFVGFRQWLAQPKAER